MQVWVQEGNDKQRTCKQQTLQAEVHRQRPLSRDLSCRWLHRFWDFQHGFWFLYHYRTNTGKTPPQTAASLPPPPPTRTFGCHVPAIHQESITVVPFCSPRWVKWNSLSWIQLFVTKNAHEIRNWQSHSDINTIRINTMTSLQEFGCV